MNESQKKLVIGSVAVLGLIGVAGAFYFWPKSEPPPPVEVQQQPPPKITPEPAPNYPVPAPPKETAVALPELEASDSLFADLSASLFGADAIQDLLVRTDIARHIVVTIDNLPRKKIAERLRPVKPIDRKFTVIGPEGAQTIAKENAARYTAAVRLFDAVSAQTLAAAYFKVYPLLQQAYVDLGYPTGYFNNRLVEVIDHLLATPTVQEPIKVVQPNVLYEFADPALEALSAGQKILIRIGPENAAAVKRKLRELRSIITTKGAVPTSPV